MGTFKNAIKALFTSLGTKTANTTNGGVMLLNTGTGEPNGMMTVANFAKMMNSEVGYKKFGSSGFSTSSYLKIAFPAEGETIDVYCDASNKRAQLEIAYIGSKSTAKISIKLISTPASGFNVFFVDTTEKCVYVKLRYDGLVAAIPRFYGSINTSIVTFSSDPATEIIGDIVV